MTGDYEIPNVHAFRQVGSGCVPATVKTLTSYYGMNLSYRSIITDLHCNIREDGTSIYDLLLFLVGLGMQIYPFMADIDIIRQAIAKKIPIISITQNDNGSDHCRLIYALESETKIKFCDPSLGKITEDIKKYMSDSKELCIIAIPNGLTVGKEIINQIMKDQEYFNLMGVIYDELGLDSDSEEMYKRGLYINPDNGDILNNYALLLKRMGRKEEAIVACKHALEVEPGVEEYRITFEELYDVE